MIIIVTITFLSFVCHRATLRISTFFVYVRLAHVRVFRFSYSVDLSHHTISNTGMCTMLYFRFDISLFKTCLHIVFLRVLYKLLCVLGCYVVRSIVVFMFVCVCVVSMLSN